MAINVESFIDDNHILRITFSGTWEEGQSQPDFYMNNFLDALDDTVLGMFVTNDIPSTMSMFDSQKFIRMIPDDTSLIAAANYKTYIPDQEEIEAITIQRMVASRQKIQIRAFYDPDEAEEWLLTTIREHLEEQ